MGNPIVLLGIPGSLLTGEVAAHLGCNSMQHYTLSLDAPLEGKPVTVAPGKVMWEGIDLLHAGAIFVEKPVFPWPQMELPPERFRKNGDFKQGVVFQRESTSLIVSAILIAGEVRRVINRPATAHLAISPSIALDYLARDGIVVHPWRLEPATTGKRSDTGFILDASGRERWHSPTSPHVGEPSLIYEPFKGEVVTFIVVGGKTIGALYYENGEHWAEKIRLDAVGELRIKDDMITGENPPEPLDPQESFPDARDLAGRTALSLKLDFAAVSIRTGVSPPTVLLCEAGPDLAAWNRILKGHLAAALADFLTFLASF